MKNFPLQGLFYLFVVLIAFSACKDDDIDPDKLAAYEDAYTDWTADPRGDIIEYSLEQTWTRDQVDSLLNSFGDPTLALLTPQYGVKLYKVNHKTLDAKGEDIVEASGLTVVPFGPNLERAGVAAYQHGTVMKKADVPSHLYQEHMIGIILAGQAGLVVSMSDYLGMGDGIGRHPYVHAKSEATCGVDMLRASKELCGEVGLALSEKLFIFGYSQGGHGAMAMHKEIEENHDDEFTVTAAAPMAGPYDMAGAQAETFLVSEPYDAPYYLPYFLFSYNEVYDLYDSPSDFLASPYDQTLPPLFDGTHSGGEVNNAMPTIPNEIIRPEILEAFKYNYNHPLRKALADNNLYDWSPKAPVLLCHCEGDNLVPYENTLVAYNTFLDRGVDVELENPGNQQHGDCVFPCLLKGFLWFDQYL